LEFVLRRALQQAGRQPSTARGRDTRGKP
jgi:hypothetical protein